LSDRPGHGPLTVDGRNPALSYRLPLRFDFPGRPDSCLLQVHAIFFVVRRLFAPPPCPSFSEAFVFLQVGRDRQGVGLPQVLRNISFSSLPLLMSLFAPISSISTFAVSGIAPGSTLSYGFALARLPGPVVPPPRCFFFFCSLLFFSFLFFR